MIIMATNKPDGTKESKQDTTLTEKIDEIVLKEINFYGGGISPSGRKAIRNLIKSEVRKARIDGWNRLIQTLNLIIDDKKGALESAKSWKIQAQKHLAQLEKENK